MTNCWSCGARQGTLRNICQTCGALLDLSPRFKLCNKCGELIHVMLEHCSFCNESFTDRAGVLEIAVKSRLKSSQKE